MNLIKLKSNKIIAIKIVFQNQKQSIMCGLCTTFLGKVYKCYYTIRIDKAKFSTTILFSIEICKKDIPLYVSENFQHKIHATFTNELRLLQM